MSGPRPILLSWSSGKDSAWALHELRADPRFAVRGLLTTVSADHDRVSMHGVRRELLERQAYAAGLPLFVIELPVPCSDDQYASACSRALDAARTRGITGVAFGDLFLADVRSWREQQMATAGMDAWFPLWGRDTTALAHAMLDAGLRAVITCVDSRQAPREFAGAAFDPDLLARLPAAVDPCGERGEFHTFAWRGPMFDRALPVRAGATVDRDGFLFTDLLPANAAAGQIGGEDVS